MAIEQMYNAINIYFPTYDTFISLRNPGRSTNYLLQIIRRARL